MTMIDVVICLWMFGVVMSLIISFYVILDNLFLLHFKLLFLTK
jgi:hypothetical protein